MAFKMPIQIFKFVEWNNWISCSSLRIYLNKERIMRSSIRRKSVQLYHAYADGQITLVCSVCSGNESNGIQSEMIQFLWHVHLVQTDFDTSVACVVWTCVNAKQAPFSDLFEKKVIVFFLSFICMLAAYCVRSGNGHNPREILIQYLFTLYERP